jgi:hypothetical protein
LTNSLSTSQGSRFRRGPGDHLRAWRYLRFSIPMARLSIGRPDAFSWLAGREADPAASAESSGFPDKTFHTTFT